MQCDSVTVVLRGGTHYFDGVQGTSTGVEFKEDLLEEIARFNCRLLLGDGFVQVDPDEGPMLIFPMWRVLRVTAVEEAKSNAN